MKKSIILLLFLIAANVIVAQDTIETFDTTSVKFEDQRNYFGVNITPLLAGVVSGKDNFNVKVNLHFDVRAEINIKVDQLENTQ